MDKEIFKYNLKNKKYKECIDILRKQIIDKLENNIKKKEKIFFYTTTSDLYNKSKEYLSKEEIKIAYELYSLDIMEETEEYILDEMMKMYQELQEI